MNYQIGSNYRTPSNFMSRNAQSVLFNAKMRMLWVIHHFWEFQASTDHFLIWEWMVSNNSNLSDNSILTLHEVRFFFGHRSFSSKSTYFLSLTKRVELINISGSNRRFGRRDNRLLALLGFNPLPPEFFFSSFFGT